MKLYVYTTTAESWDDANNANCKVVAIINGTDNADCEAKAGDLYGDTDVYGWTYNDDLSISDEIKLQKRYKYEIKGAENIIMSKMLPALCMFTPPVTYKRKCSIDTMSLLHVYK